MGDAKFNEKLEKILKNSGSATPPDHEKIINMARTSKTHHDRLQQKLSTLQQSLDYLRLSVKYLIFDLEATRRENIELRKRLNDRPPRPDSDQ